MKVGILHYLSTAYAIDPAVLAKKAEELGFDSLWLPEHPIMPVATVSPFPLGGVLSPISTLSSLTPSWGWRGPPL